MDLVCRYLFLAAFLVVLLQPLAAEVFTSTSQLVEHFQVEKSLYKALRNYIKDEKQRLKKLKTFLRLKKRESQKRFSDLEHLSGLTINPVDAFTTLNRFGEDWQKVGNQLGQRAHREGFLNVFSRHNKFFNLFSNTDFEGAMDALVRLSKVYEISPQTLLQGKINNCSAKPVYKEELVNRHSGKLTNKTNSNSRVRLRSSSQMEIDNRSVSYRLTMMDSFRLGRQAYINGHRKQAKIWMENTIAMMGSQYGLSDMTEKTNRNEVLNYLAFLEYLFANYNSSLSYYQEMYRNDPSDKSLMENMKIMERLVANNAIGKRVSDDDEDEDEFMINYANQCRKADQDVPLPSSDLRLTCYYDNRHPRLYLKPSRVETLSINPRIALFRNVLSDKEMNGIVSLARPKLQRAGVNNLETGLPEIADYRTSKSAWLREKDGELVRKINTRIGGLTGLNMNTAEALQVNNYGLGGHYEPHVDHALNMSISSIAKMGRGNRIATLMFYGDALFWYNLKKCGEGDIDTLHAGCPVLQGDKWVANKWFHEYGNEFLRPCGLTQDE